MPIFEFKCTKCEHIFDEIFSIVPEKGPSCPICENDSEKIDIPGCSFSLTGSGWSSHGYSKTPVKIKPPTTPNQK